MTSLSRSSLSPRAPASRHFSSLPPTKPYAKYAQRRSYSRFELHLYRCFVSQLTWGVCIAFVFCTGIGSTAVPEQLWAEFQNHSLSVLRQLPPDDERLKEIPPQFYAAFPLDSASKTRGTAGSFGYPSETYKVHTTAALT